MGALFAFSMATFAAVDNDPLNAGTTMARNAYGTTYAGPYFNPAILGMDNVPSGSILVAPFTNYGVGLWSNKLAASPFLILPWLNAKDSSDFAKQTSKLFNASFGTDGKTPDEVSDIMANELKGGITVYGGARVTALSFANRRIAFDITTHIDQSLTIPEGVLFALFTKNKGILPGNTLDFSKFSEEQIWATDFTFSIGLPVNIPELNKFFKLKYGAGGIGVKYVMGHSFLKASMNSGSVYFNDATNALDVKGEMQVQEAGFGKMQGTWDDTKPFFSGGFPISGHGIGIDLGGILYDEKGSLSVNFQNLGVLFWMNKTKEVTLKINKPDLRLYEIVKGVESKKKAELDQASLSIFNRDQNQYLSDSRDTLHDANGFVTALPLTMNIGYVYRWDLMQHWANKKNKWLAQYALVGTNYEQQLAGGPGRSYIPRLSLGGEAGVLDAYLPLRMGFIFGGSELIGSSLGFGLNFRYFQFNAAYKAIGTAWFVPKRGMELAVGMNFNWGVHKKPVSHCPFIPPPNFSGVLGRDSCPDPDQDRDSLCDPWVSDLHKDSLYAHECHGVDKCPTQPEDYDGYNDADGCPDYDNHVDGIPDSLDKCPNAAEDMDGFQDKDGCPDYDNDHDGIPDTLDKCPNEPEDIDGFEDKDGCPDYDNDKDGIPDTLDKCINEPENYNGYKDDDGCPDTLPKPTAKEEKALNKALRAINFKTASAELTSDSYTALISIANFLKQYPYLRYEVQGHTDSRGNDDYNLLLSAARAASVRYYLVGQQNVPDSTLIAIGYGKTRPIATNNTAQGRALNRRVEFKVIDTKEDYQRLKLLELDFKERVKAAQIKGAKY